MKLKISSFLNIIFILFTNHQYQLCRQISDFKTSTEPRELQSISHLTVRAASLSVISSFFKVFLLISAALKRFKSLHFQAFIVMYRNLSLSSSTDSDVFYMEHSSAESSPIRNNTPANLNSTQLSGAIEREAITIFSVASPEPQLVIIDSDSNETTFPYEFGTQHSIVPPNLNGLNLPPNPFNVLATMTVIQQDQEDSCQSPEQSDPSPISTPPMNFSNIEGWETPHTTTDDNTFYSPENEPIGIFLLMRHLTPMSPDESLPLRTHPPHRRPHRNKRED